MRVLLAVVGLAAGSIVVWLVDQWAALRLFRSPHVVYFLVDRKGVVLYVGSTNDPERRLLEHADEDEPGEWRIRIADIAIVRHCRSQRQARRIERRMIHALMDGWRIRMCGRLNNVALVGRPLVASPVRWVWLAAYRLNGALWPVCRWHAPNPTPRWQSPPQLNGTALQASWVDVQTVDPHESEGVINADGPQWAPLGAPTSADPSSSDDTPDDTPDLHRPDLRILPPMADDDVDDPAEKRREQNRNAQRRRRQRAAEQKRAAE